MRSARAITANSRRDTGQFDSVVSRGLAGPPPFHGATRSLAAPFRALALAASWFPIAHVLRRYAACASPSFTQQTPAFLPGRPAARYRDSERPAASRAQEKGRVSETLRLHLVNNPVNIPFNAIKIC